MNERIKYLDYMKFIGICCLFLAHVQGPFILEEIRGFDVPMMVLISGFLATTSITKTSSTFEYLKKRIKRLVIPSWIFLLLFYAAMLIIGQKPQIMNVVKSLFFQRDCGLAGGVWIIWVYLICAVCAPILYKYTSKKWFLPVSFAVLVIYELVIYIMPSLVNNRFFYYTVCNIIPYGVLLSIGLLIPSMSCKTKQIMFWGASLVHLLLGILYHGVSGTYLPISQFKYPPQVYYLSYGLAITILIMELLKNIEQRLLDLSVIRFVSSHSLWIYLWQIMMLTIVNYVIKISDYWFLSWLFLMFGSLLVTWIQDRIIGFLSKKTNWSVWNYFKG